MSVFFFFLTMAAMGDLTVEIVFVANVGKVGLSSGACRGGGRRPRPTHVWESEVLTESSRLLQGLAEHLVLFDVLVGHGPAGEPHGLLEVPLANLGVVVVVVIVV